MGLAETLTAVGIVVVVALAAALSLYRPRPLDMALVGALVVLGGVLLVDVIVLATDFRDADGAIDCWPRCTATQQLVRWSVALGVVLLPVLVTVAAIRAVSKRAGRIS